ncbi:putative tRNA-splicing endonuclease subunit sen54 [Neolecta irregularis DAH-3]|uniref:Putative tRNA-splicing endonuclease subunit sen54 n=1 Tax=Neolecta irregularis (strain DAH-3) TaxID=1198029 RepID=A0A1U7LRU1_NEOID|nr:putative tRNA-splicing endonuclease subunit sen54 [Neolecta irregularis DAH-3]|eukprot:OLL25377.1 putative tRNA-splicing endonuclease subunit sen54 [Neolecta irregularis DAH-3]
MVADHETTSATYENEVVELGDEQQDFRFLAQLTRNNATLPRRGEKDFEPDGTDYQNNMLKESRQAMYAALCLERKHAAKSHCEATWYADRGMAQVLQAKGIHFKSVGKATRDSTWLLPEETIFLVERGSLECWYQEGMPMSLQAVYAACMDGCGAERYQVYSYLKRGGYHVRRADTFNCSVARKVDPLGRSIFSTIGVWTRGLFSFLYMRFLAKEINLISNGPLVPPGVYHTYAEIFKKLQIIPSHSNKILPSLSPSTEPSLRITYNVWKPDSNFKKTAPGPPDFRIAVVDAITQCVPNLQQLSNLFDEIPLDKIQSNNPFGRLKSGSRNVILAVVDSGLTSFLRFNDISFSDEKIWEGGPKKSKGKARVKAQRTKGKGKT